MNTIIHLDHNFVRVYNLQEESLELVDELVVIAKTLELSKNFVHFWVKLWSEKLNQSTRIYFLINSNSSFTDSRIIFVWLQSWKMFTHGRFGIAQTGMILDLTRLSHTSLMEVLNGANFEAQSLDYATEARVTVK